MPENNARYLDGRIYAALVTPMDKNENVCYEAIRDLVKYEISQGVEGFYVCGSSGEGLLLSMEERKRVLETALDAAEDKVPVISHIGTICTKDVIDLALHAESAGAAAVSMIPPYYYSFCMEEIIRYYLDVANALKTLSVIVYNIPQYTGVAFDKNNAAELFANERIIGMKHTSKDLYSLERLKTAFPEKVYFNGFDEQYLAALAMGVTTSIGSCTNTFPDSFRSIRALYQEGKMQEALSKQNELNAAIETMISAGIFSAVKYLLTKKGIPCGACRKPFRPLTDADKAILDQITL